MNNTFIEYGFIYRRSWNGIVQNWPVVFTNSSSMCRTNDVRSIYSGSVWCTNFTVYPKDVFISVG